MNGCGCRHDTYGFCFICNKMVGPTATEVGNQKSVLKAILKHAGRAKNGKHHFTVADQMNAIIALAEHGLKSIDVDTPKV